MGSYIPSSMQGGCGLYGAGMQVCTTGAVAPMGPAFVNPRRLMIFSTKTQLEESLLGHWVGADKKLFWEIGPALGHYDEIIILPYKYEALDRFDLDVPQKRELFAFMLEHLPSSLRPGGRIIDMNNLNEEQNEPQGLSGQADASKPDAG